MMFSLGVIVFTATVNSITVFVVHWDHTALAWATAVGLSLNYLTLYLYMRKFASGLETVSLVQALIKLIAGIVAMSAVCLVAKYSLMADWTHLSFMLRCAGLGVSISVAAAAYFAVTKKLKVEEAGEFLSLLGRRFGKR